MNLFLTMFVTIVGTIFVYLIARKIYARFPHPFTLPLLIGTIILILILQVFKIPYEAYYLGGEWLERMLGPAVVALAYPLYRQFGVLRKHFWTIIISVTVGSSVGIISGIYLTKWFQFESEIVASVVPKSVTTPVAMDVAETFSGIPSLTAVLVMVAGIGGAVLGSYIFKWFNITSELAKGIATGSASHAIGTAKVLENSEREGVASSVAMIVSALIIVIAIPIIAILLK